MAVKINVRDFKNAVIMFRGVGIFIWTWNLLKIKFSAVWFLFQRMRLLFLYTYRVLNIYALSVVFYWDTKIFFDLIKHFYINLFIYDHSRFIILHTSEQPLQLESLWNMMVGYHHQNTNFVLGEIFYRIFLQEVFLLPYYIIVCWQILLLQSLYVYVLDFQSSLYESILLIRWVLAWKMQMDCIGPTL